MSLELLALHEMSPQSARQFLRDLLRKDGKAVDAIYGAFSRWTWRSLVERRMDEELRDWHRLILDVAATAAGLASRGEGEVETTQGTAGNRSSPVLTERLRALADLVRESITAAQISVPAELLQRAHVAEILQAMAGQSAAFVDRKSIADAARLKDANLSRVLSLLAVNGLVEREARGRAAAFRITRKGLNAIGLASDAADPAQPRATSARCIAPVLSERKGRQGVRHHTVPLRVRSRNDELAAGPPAAHFPLKYNETEATPSPQYSYREADSPAGVSASA